LAPAGSRFFTANRQGRDQLPTYDKQLAIMDATDAEVAVRSPEGLQPRSKAACVRRRRQEERTSRRGRLATNREQSQFSFVMDAFRKRIALFAGKPA
jgi:hypothetical protein